MISKQMNEMDDACAVRLICGQPQLGSDTNLTADCHVRVNVGRRTKAQRFVRRVNFPTMRLHVMKCTKGGVNRYRRAGLRSEAPGCVAWGRCRWPSDPRQGCNKTLAASVGRVRRNSARNGRGSRPNRKHSTTLVAPCPLTYLARRRWRQPEKESARNNVTGGQGGRRTFGEPRRAPSVGASILLNLSRCVRSRRRG